MKKKLSRKRGFTLVEMIITLAITIILVTSIAALITAVVSERRRSGSDYNASADIYFAESAVYAWFENFAGEDSYTLSAKYGGDGRICGVTAIVGDGAAAQSKEYNIFFDAENKKLITPEYADGWFFSTIKNITFEIYAAGTDGGTGGNAIKVNITYDGASKPISLLLSGRAKR